MNEIDHEFPLPEVEQHKLDEVKEEIVHPISRRARRVLQGNVWMAIGISVAAGVACGFLCGRSAEHRSA